jgi:hypothetical protein
LFSAAWRIWFNAAGPAAMALWPGTVPTVDEVLAGGRATEAGAEFKPGFKPGLEPGPSPGFAAGIVPESAPETWRSSIDWPTPVSMVRRFT